MKNGEEKRIPALFLLSLQGKLIYFNCFIGNCSIPLSNILIFFLSLNSFNRNNTNIHIYIYMHSHNVYKNSLCDRQCD